MKKALTNAERAQRSRVRKRSLGYVQIGPWVHRDDCKQVMDFVAKLNAARGNVVTRR